MDLKDILLITINFTGALAVFLYAMKLMSEGLQKAAGSRMRALLPELCETRSRCDFDSTLEHIGRHEQLTDRMEMKAVAVEHTLMVMDSNLVDHCCADHVINASEAIDSKQKHQHNP